MRISTLLIFSLIPALSFAQRNFQPGSIVSSKGDTASGMIDYKEWSVNPRHVFFTRSESSDIQKLDVNDLNAFEVTNRVTFRTFALNISMDNLRASQIHERDTSFKHDTLFLKLLAKSPDFELYAYSDLIKTRYFLGKPGETPEELIFKEYMKNGELIRENTFRNQLEGIMHMSGKTNNVLRNRIAKTQYAEPSLKKTVQQLYEVKAPKPKDLGPRPSSISFFAGAGMILPSISVKGNHFFDKGTTTSNNFSPRIGAGMDLFPFRYIRKLMFRAEVSYSRQQSKMVGSSSPSHRAEYENAMDIISFTPQVVYHIYNGKNLKVPLSFGVAYNHVNLKKNRLDEYNHVSNTRGLYNPNYFDIRSHLSSLIRVGAVFNKFEVAALYQPPANVVSYVYYTVRNQFIGLQANYLIGR